MKRGLRSVTAFSTLVLLAVVALGACKPELSTDLQSSTGTRVFVSKNIVAAPPTTILPPVCNAAQQCVIPYSNSGATVTGTASGTAIGGGSATGDSAHFNSVAIAIVSASIPGCGTGTYTIQYSILYNLPDVLSSTPGPWRIIPELGTGDFTSLRGTGTWKITESNADGSNVSEWTGVMSCARQDGTS